jgi:hypothetical protein
MAPLLMKLLALALTLVVLSAARALAPSSGDLPPCTPTVPIEIAVLCSNCVPLPLNTSRCSTAESRSMKAISGRRSPSAASVSICYVPPSDPLCAREVSVPASQLAAYLAAGSTLGQCDVSCQLSVVSFGYLNPNPCAIEIPAGSAGNIVFGSSIMSSDQGQPSIFFPGLGLGTWALIVPTNASVTWEVTTPLTGEMSCATANGSSVDPCFSPCLNGSCYSLCIGCAAGGLLRNLIRVGACPGNLTFNNTVAELLASCEANLSCSRNCCAQDTCLLDVFTTEFALDPEVAEETLCFLAALGDLSTLSALVAPDPELLSAAVAFAEANASCEIGCTDLSGLGCTSPICSGGLDVPCFDGCTACGVAAALVSAAQGNANCSDINPRRYENGVAAIFLAATSCASGSGCGTDLVTCCSYAQCVAAVIIDLAPSNDNVSLILGCGYEFAAIPGLLEDPNVLEFVLESNITCLEECGGESQVFDCCLNPECLIFCYCPLLELTAEVNGTDPLAICSPLLLCSIEAAFELTLCEQECIVPKAGSVAALFQPTCDIPEVCALYCAIEVCPQVASCIQGILDVSGLSEGGECLAGCGCTVSDVSAFTNRRRAADEELSLLLAPQ